jgi:hypothetical protein
MEGNSALELTAPTTGDFANLVLVQSANAEIGNNSSINGNNGTVLDGVIYFPNADLEFTGSSTQAFQCVMVIGWTATFSGSATIQNDTSGCDAATTLMGKKIRLIG